MASSRERSGGTRVGVVAFALLVGCTGVVGPGGDEAGGPVGAPAAPPGPAPVSRPPGGPPDPRAPAPPAPETPSPETPPAAAAAGPPGAATGFIRLTRSQYLNTIADALGPEVTAGVELEEDYLSAGSAIAGAREVTVSRSGVRAYVAAAEAISARAVASANVRARLTSCRTPAGPADAACARGLVDELGRRLHRRALTADEQERWTKLTLAAAAAEGDFWAGLRWALAGLLASPQFTHRIEVGAAGGGAPTAHDLAARLSFTLWDSAPDPALLDAADSGRLATPEGFAQEVDRLLGDPARLARGLHALASDLFDLHEVEIVRKDKDRFPGDDPELRLSMRAAVQRLTEEVARSGGDFREIFEPGFAFVNRRLGALAGLPASSNGLQKVALPTKGPRVGLLTEPALLAAHSRELLTSPTLRGLFVRKTLLCTPVPDAPQDVDNSLPNTANGRTRREQLEDHMKNPACSGCHRFMDPIGFGLEGFDALGAVQAKDNGVPVDTTGALDGAPFNDARGLSRLVREHPSLPGCLVRGVARHAFGAAVGDEAHVQALTATFQGDGHRLLPFLRALVLDPAFRAATR